MILGAGIYQVPLIRLARARGLETLSVSPEGNYPGFAEADRAVYLDTRDRKGILAAARREGISAIATTGTDVAMPTLGAVCDAMDLSGVTLQAAYSCGALFVKARGLLYDGNRTDDPDRRRTRNDDSFQQGDSHGAGGGLCGRRAENRQAVGGRKIYGKGV